MEIYLIRHTSPNIGKGIIYGQTDVPLNASFEMEARTILQNIPTQLDMIFTSPSKRCMQLAELIAEARPLVTLESSRALMELDFGEWEGQSWAQVAGPACDSWMADFVNLSPPGGESMLQMELRISIFFRNLFQQDLAKVALISHAGVIRTVLAHFQSIALKDAFSIPVAMGQVIKLDLSSW